MRIADCLLRLAGAAALMAATAGCGSDSNNHSNGTDAGVCAPSSGVVAAGVRWFGRGPQENYLDRHTGAFVGVYQSSVRNWITHYVRPQENANRTDVRWIEFTGAGGRGLRVKAQGKPFGVSAWPYSATDLAEAKHDYELPRRDFITVNVDAQQMGVGGDNSWGLPVHEEYRLSPKNKYRFALSFEPVR